MKKKFYKSLCYKVLEALSNLRGPDKFLDDTWHKSIVERVCDISARPSRNIYAAIYNLEKQMLIKRRKRGRKLIFEITPLGRKYLSIGAILNNFTDEIKAQVWDGKWRLVIFDVPEKKRWIRNFLRRELLYNGFYQLQKSVWITPYNIVPEIERLFKEMGAAYFTRYMIVEYINYEKDLLKHFKLA